MDITIIIPIYNVQEYLQECLESVQAALTPSFTAEVYCINDGSTDQSKEIAQSFADKDNRFRVITQINGGYGKAINTGMRAARGRFVTIVESDDVILPNAYPVLLELLKQDEGLDFVKTPYQPFTADGPRPQMSVPPHGQTASDMLNSPDAPPKPRTFLDDRLIFEPPAIWAGIYRREVLERNGITLPETPGAGYQDTCFSAMCFLNGMTYQWVNDRYYMYRVDRETASRHVLNRRSEIIYLFRFIRNNLERNEVLNKTTAPHFYAVYFRRLIWFMQRVRTEHRFNLFIEAYRDFNDVWENKALMLAVKALLPGSESDQFEHFWQGRHGKLYAA